MGTQSEHIFWWNRLVKIRIKESMQLQWLHLAILVAVAAPALAGLKESCERSSKSKCRDPLSSVPINSNTELRTYPGGNFAVSEVSLSDPSVGIMSYAFNLFMPLWNYMKQGNNADNQIFEMSMPAPIMYEKLTSGMWKCSLAFWLSAGGSAPAPTGVMTRGVRVVNMADQRYYVKSFPYSFKWWEFLSMSTPESEFDKNRDELKDELRQLGKRFVENAYANVGYDSPFVRTDRHNEVWIQAL